jgi:hypothetical protein
MLQRTNTELYAFDFSVMDVCTMQSARIDGKLTDYSLVLKSHPKTRNTPTLLKSVSEEKTSLRAEPSLCTP